MAGPPDLNPTIAFMPMRCADDRCGHGFTGFVDFTDEDQNFDVCPACYANADLDRGAATLRSRPMSRSDYVQALEAVAEEAKIEERMLSRAHALEHPEGYHSDDRIHACFNAAARARTRKIEALARLGAAKPAEDAPQREMVPADMALHDAIINASEDDIRSLFGDDAVDDLAERARKVIDRALDKHYGQPVMPSMTEIQRFIQNKPAEPATEEQYVVNMYFDPSRGPEVLRDDDTPEEQEPDAVATPNIGILARIARAADAAEVYARRDPSWSIVFRNVPPSAIIDVCRFACRVVLAAESAREKGGQP